ELATTVGASVFRYGVADLQMQSDSGLRECLLHHGEGIISLRIGGWEKIFLAGIAGSVLKQSSAHVIELNEEVLLTLFRAGQSDPGSGLYVVVAGLAAMEVRSGWSGFPCRENAVFIGIVDGCGENHCSVCNSGIQRCGVLVRLQNRRRGGDV